jgi:hypothetical protein
MAKFILTRKYISLFPLVILLIICILYTIYLGNIAEQNMLNDISSFYARPHLQDVPPKKAEAILTIPLILEPKILNARPPSFIGVHNSTNHSVDENKPLQVFGDNGIVL